MLNFSKTLRATWQKTNVMYLASDRTRKESAGNSNSSSAPQSVFASFLGKHFAPSNDSSRFCAFFKGPLACEKPSKIVK
jgi:hypothetical protein